uniref:TetR/AcrR family transcriptional regulator n=1 Tax=Fundidesulfovibrio putealis TaxID=270496 RepID=A0A7C4AI66_9BACT
MPRLARSQNSRAGNSSLLTRLTVRLNHTVKMTTQHGIPDQTQQDTILDAAATVFAEHGYAGARVEAIAAAAGLNKAMLYYRVGGKAALYEAAVLRLFGRVAQAVEQGSRAPGGPVQGIAGVLEALARLFESDPRMPRIMAWEMASGGRNLPDAVVGVFARIIGCVGPLAVRMGMDPVLGYLSLLGPMVIVCLSGPLRKRMGASLPPGMDRIAGLNVADMAAFLTELYRRAERPEERV